MFVGLKLVEIADDSKVVLALTGQDFNAIQALLADCPYRYASRVMVQLVAAAEAQQRDGVLDAIQRAVDDRKKLASIPFPLTDNDMN